MMFHRSSGKWNYKKYSEDLDIDKSYDEKGSDFFLSKPFCLNLRIHLSQMIPIRP